MDIHHGQGHAAQTLCGHAAWTLTWTCSIDMDMQHRHAVWTWTCSVDMDTQHEFGHAAWTC